MPSQASGRSYVGRLRDLERDRDLEGRALPDPARNLDGAAHGVDELLCDGHAEARALVRAARARRFLGERLEDAREELRAHADPRVRDGPAADRSAVLVGPVVEGGRDLAAGTVVLDAVAIDIDKYLAQVERAVVSIFWRFARASSASSGWSQLILSRPRMPFRGVRMSWLMRRRKSVLARAARSALASAASSSSWRFFSAATVSSISTKTPMAVWARPFLSRRNFAASRTQT